MSNNATIVSSSPITHEGRNCWRRVRANHLSFIIDADQYFCSLLHVFLKAQNAIYILGWDIDSRLKLNCTESFTGLPKRLGELLNAIVKQRPQLHIYILSWDFAFIYALERESFSKYKFGGHTHPNIHVKLDGYHPVGASHHQKVVVVDDMIAFSGGIDLCTHRWDTRDHFIHHPARLDINNHPYPPFHDAQLAVSGPAAQVLGNLFRVRWYRATRKLLNPPPLQASIQLIELWPKPLKPDLENVIVAISRTEPAWNSYPGTHEVAQLFLDAITAAQTAIYIENQYLTSFKIAEALIQRLSQAQGPEIVIVGPRECSGWLEKTTMDVLRARLLNRLREADHFGRLGIFYPLINYPPLMTEVFVHAKILVIDDTLARVGSANLSNRSMGLDTECDVSVESNGEPKVKAGIANFRNGLLGEHLGVTAESVASVMREKHNSLLQTIAFFNGQERSLEPLDLQIDTWVDELLPPAAVVDPERPLALDDLLEYLMPAERRISTYRVLIKTAAAIALLITIIALWHWSHLSRLITPQLLAEWSEHYRYHTFALLVVIAAYIFGGLVMVPVNLLNFAVAWGFGAWLGFPYAMLGSLASATVSFWIGRWLGHEKVRRLAGSYLDRLRQKLSRRGILAVVLIRMVAVAPYTVVNLVAGVLHFPFKQYLIGTAIGMSPGIALLSLFGYQLGWALRKPSWGAWILLIIVAAMLVLLGRWLIQQRGGTTQSS